MLSRRFAAFLVGVLACATARAEIKVHGAHIDKVDDIIEQTLDQANSIIDIAIYSFTDRGIPCPAKTKFKKRVREIVYIQVGRPIRICYGQHAKGMNSARSLHRRDQRPRYDLNALLMGGDWRHTA